MNPDTQPIEAEAAVVAELAARAAEPNPIDPTKPYSVIVPKGASLETVDLRHALDRLPEQPSRTTGTVQLHTVDDFARYVTRHDDQDATTIWVHAENYRIVAVLNDHGRSEGDVNGAAWGDHRASLQMRHSDEWRHWSLLDGQLLEQEKFAEHLQARSVDIVEPSAAEMLEVAQTLQGKTNVEWTNALRLQDGQVKASYTEDATARAGEKGDIDIPDEFVLGLAPFLGEDAYRVNARLRWRLRSGNMMLGYQLERPGDVLRDALDKITDRIAQQFTGDRVFVGEPRS